MRWGAIVAAAAVLVTGAQAGAETGSATRSQGGVEGRTLPAGHPPIGEETPNREVLQDSNVVDATLAPGKVLVEVVGSDGRPVSGGRVDLLVTRDSVAQGRSESERAARAGQGGMVHFAGLPVGSSHSYRVAVDYRGTRYLSARFALSPSAGERVRVHVYPATDELEKLEAGSVVSMAWVFLQPLEETFDVRVMVQFINRGKMSWVPKRLVLRVPDNAVAVVGEEGQSGLEVGVGRGEVRLSGTVGPGEHSVMYGFQLPRGEASEQRLKVGLPPRWVEARVMLESSAKMTLAVRGFPAATATRSDAGRRVLIARGLKGVEEVRELDILLGGLPVVGNGRWMALAFALGLSAWGVATAIRGRGSRRAGAVGGADAAAAREVLLEEAVALERERASGRIGPRSYEEARGEILDALSRLESLKTE